jgi:hypothetical protein
MKKNFFVALLPLFLMAFATTISAQTKQPKPKSDSKPKTSKPTKKDDEEDVRNDEPKPKKGQSSDVQVFDKAKDDYDYFDKKKGDNSNPKNFIKINPFEALDGTFPIFFERVLTNKFSVEAGLGLTTTSETFAELRGIFGNSDYNNFVKGNTGNLFKLGFRYYSSKSDDIPEGPYFALEYQVKTYKFDALRYDASGSSTVYSAPYTPSTVTNGDFRILFGYQALSSGNFSWDYYLGVGWRQHTFNGWYNEDVNSSSKYTLGSSSSARPIFILGVKIGIGF